jgi:hypothetical protein
MQVARRGEAPFMRPTIRITLTRISTGGRGHIHTHSDKIIGVANVNVNLFFIRCGNSAGCA